MNESNTPRRPLVTPDMKLAAARELARHNNWDDTQARDIARAFNRFDDGYELAKKLEGSYGWDIGVMEVEALDCMGSEVDKLHREACKAWVKEHNIQPPHPIGTMTTRGEITGICEYEPATPAAPASAPADKAVGQGEKRDA